MIVSLPAIAVSAMPGSASIGGVGPSGKFSTALAEATKGNEDTSAKPKAVGETDQGNVTAKGSAKHPTKPPSSSANRSSDSPEPPASAVPESNRKILDTAPLPAFLPPVPESAVGEACGTISGPVSPAKDKFEPEGASAMGRASAGSPIPEGPPPVSVPPDRLRATSDQASLPARSVRPEVSQPALATPSAEGKPIQVAFADIRSGTATNALSTVVIPAQPATKMSSASSAADKSAPTAGWAMDVAPAVSPASGGPPPVSVPPDPLRATSDQADNPTRSVSPEVAEPALVIPSAQGKPIPAALADIPSGTDTNGLSTIAIPAQPATKTSSAGIGGGPISRSTTADPKLVSREGMHSASTIQMRTSAMTALLEQRKANADLPPMPVLSPSPLAQGDTKPQAPQETPTSHGPAPKSEIGVAPSSAETPRKDRDADGNAAAPSGNGDSSGFVGVPMAKPNTSDAATPTSGISASNGVGPAQVSQPSIEGKAVAAGAFSKTTDAAGKGAGQSSGVPDTEATADAAASHLSSSLQAAKLVERAGQTELRVGIPAGEFGSVDIRTSMGRNQFTAEISVERAELGRALTAELPGLHNRLQEHRVPPANIILQDRSTGNGSSDLRQGPRHNPYAQSMNHADAAERDPAPPIAMEAMESSQGLDIHI